MTKNLDLFRQHFIHASSWTERKDGVPLYLLDNLTGSELELAEKAMIDHISSGDPWAIEGLGYIKSTLALPTLYKLLPKSRKATKLRIAHAIYRICGDISMTDLVLKEVPSIKTQPELIEVLYMLPEFKDERVNLLLQGYREHKEYLIAYNATRALGLPTDEVVTRFRQPKPKQEFWKKFLG